MTDNEFAPICLVGLLTADLPVPRGRGFMFVTEEEAAAIYARVFLKWYGPRAQSIARSMVHSLGKKGDESGVKAWERVSEEIEQLLKRSASA